ncbi:hypothetical protein, partial [Nostoc sp. FACHB-190]|uniref:hypothetical protein n=1 Tax=Nostoc sp. FACHB-190 TaxID=2692838 RepID=UPI00168438C4
MTENLTTGFSSEPSEPDLNLGIKQPLLPHQPLGSKFIRPKFLSPLGAKSLSNFDSSIFFNPVITDFNIIENSFQDSPFFSESKSQHFNTPSHSEGNKVKKNSSNSPNIQQKSAGSNSSLSRDILLSQDSDIRLSPSEAIANIDVTTPNTNYINPTIENNDIGEINKLSNTPQQAHIISSISDNKDSKLIQPQINTNNSVTNQKNEALPNPSQPRQHTSLTIQPQADSGKAEYSQTELNEKAIAPYNTGKESPIIQPKIDSNNSVSLQAEIVENDNSRTTLNEKAIAPSNLDTESPVIQPKLDSNNSAYHQAEIVENDNSRTTLNEKAIAPFNTATESPVIQPKLDSNNSAYHQAEIVENDNSRTTLNEKAIAPFNTATESPVIQPKLDSNNSAYHQAEIVENDNSRTTLNEKAIAPSNLGTESNIIQPKLDSNNSVYPQSEIVENEYSQTEFNEKAI